MATITEDYVSFEMAKLLKEKGFPLPSTNFEDWAFCIYDENGGIHWGCYHPDWYARVTHQMAMKWLREVHKIYIMIDRSWSMEDSYQYCICVNDDFVHLIQQDSVPNTYEEAVEAAIKYCLENLI